MHLGENLKAPQSTEYAKICKVSKTLVITFNTWNTIVFIFSYIYKNMKLYKYPQSNYEEYDDRKWDSF